jgi:hypothetical protein
VNARRLLAIALALLLPLAAGCTTVSEGTARPSDVAVVAEKPDTGDDEPSGDTDADDDPGSDTGTSGDYEWQTLTVSNWGATVRVPADWTVARETSDALLTCKVTGPNGWYVRVDETRSWSGMPDPWEAIATLGGGLAKKYDDYKSSGGRDVTIDGTPMVRWDFSHTSPDGIHLIKADVFFQPSADLAPCAILVGFPSDEGGVAADLAEQILASLDVTP